MPISADPVNGPSRLRLVQRMVALHVTPCPRCGKGSPLDSLDPEQVCQCGSAPENWAGRCWAARNAVLEATGTDRSEGWREATERSGWR